MRDDGMKQKSCRDRCYRLEWSSGDMLKAGPPDVTGRPEGPRVPEVRAWRRGGLGGHHSRAAALPASLPGCLSVSSASLPPYTLSHFIPMSLPDQGGGRGKKRKREKKEEKREEEKEERQIED